MAAPPPHDCEATVTRGGISPLRGSAYVACVVLGSMSSHSGAAGLLCTRRVIDFLVAVLRDTAHELLSGTSARSFVRASLVASHSHPRRHSVAAGGRPPAVPGRHARCLPIPGRNCSCAIQSARAAGGGDGGAGARSVGARGGAGHSVRPVCSSGGPVHGMVRGCWRRCSLPLRRRGLNAVHAHALLCAMLCLVACACVRTCAGSRRTRCWT